MKRFIIAIVVLCTLLPIAAIGCLQGGSGGVVNVHNWGEFIDESVLRIFEKETGIKVNYSTYETNEQLYSLMRRGGANIDVIIPSDYMIARMIEEGMLAELDFSNIPNFSLIDERYKGLGYDPDDKYSVAYMTGTVGLIYNSAKITDDISSWGALFDESYSGQILMFDNPRDAFGIALKHLGFSLNTTSEAEIYEAFNLLAHQKPFLQAYVMDQIFDKLESGEAWIGPYYAGDFLTMHENNPDLRFVRPSEGTNFFVDAMCIPADAQNKENAEVFINFMTRTDIAIMNMEYVMYASANFEAAEEFKDELSAEDYAIMFASSDVLAKSEIYYHLPRNILELYDELWVELKR